MMRELFDHAKDTLSIQQLESLANMYESAELDAENLGETLNVLAAVMASSDKSSLPSDEQIASVLWGLSYRAKHFGELIAVSSEARHLLRQRIAQQAA